MRLHFHISDPSSVLNGQCVTVEFEASAAEALGKAQIPQLCAGLGRLGGSV